jgi:hypothetical protein
VKHIAVILILLVGGSSLALAQSAGGSSSGGSAPSGSAATGPTGYAGGTLSTGHTISGSSPNVSNALSHAATGGDVDASSVTQTPTPHDNAVDTPAAERAMKNLGNTDIGILKK